MSEFKFKLHEQVQVSANESGMVIARAQYLNAENAYLVRYVAGDGRQVELWWTENALTAR